MPIWIPITAHSVPHSAAMHAPRSARHSTILIHTFGCLYLSISIFLHTTRGIQCATPQLSSAFLMISFQGIRTVCDHSAIVHCVFTLISPSGQHIAVTMILGCCRAILTLWPIQMPFVPTLLHSHSHAFFVAPIFFKIFWYRGGHKIFLLWHLRCVRADAFAAKNLSIVCDLICASPDWIWVWIGFLCGDNFFWQQHVWIAIFLQLSVAVLFCVFWIWFFSSVSFDWLLCVLYLSFWHSSTDCVAKILIALCHKMCYFYE